MGDNRPWFPDTEHEEGVLTESKQKVKKPPMYKVLLHNDDYTTMDFVTFVLISVFNKQQGEATAIMLNVHQTGIGIAGVYTYEIAEAKVDKVSQLAREREFPLLCTMEEDK
jgi:ATP-dependent Clp protease adaptor protein ClpS